MQLYSVSQQRYYYRMLSQLSSEVYDHNSDFKDV